MGYRRLYPNYTWTLGHSCSTLCEGIWWTLWWPQHGLTHPCSQCSNPLWISCVPKSSDGRCDSDSNTKWHCSYSKCCRCSSGPWFLSLLHPPLWALAFMDQANLLSKLHTCPDGQCLCRNSFGSSKQLSRKCTWSAQRYQLSCTLSFGIYCSHWHQETI